MLMTYLLASPHRNADGLARRSLQKSDWLYFDIKEKFIEARSMPTRATCYECKFPSLPPTLIDAIFATLK